MPCEPPLLREDTKGQYNCGAALTSTTVYIMETYYHNNYRLVVVTSSSQRMAGFVTKEAIYGGEKKNPRFPAERGTYIEIESQFTISMHISHRLCRTGQRDKQKCKRHRIGTFVLLVAQ